MSPFGSIEKAQRVRAEYTRLFFYHNPQKFSEAEDAWLRFTLIHQRITRIVPSDLQRVLFIVIYLNPHFNL